MYGNDYVDDNEEPNDINMRKLMSLLEKVEVSGKLVRGVSTATFTCKYGVNKASGPTSAKIFFSKLS